ncbi:MAG: LAS seventeen-binding protein 3 [Bacillota bacterium]
MTVKKNKNVRTKELLMEKELRRRRNTDPEFAVGENFVEEPTGSATMVNLDGRWDFDHPVKK